MDNYDFAAAKKQAAKAYEEIQARLKAKKEGEFADAESDDEEEEEGATEDTA